MQSATDAELLVIFSEVSLFGPPEHNMPVAYWKLFKIVFPEESKNIAEQLKDGTFGTGLRETHRGTAKELITGLREAWFVKDRNHTPDPARWNNLCEDRKRYILSGQAEG